MLEEQDCECSTLNIKNALEATDPDEDTEDDPSIVEPPVVTGIVERGNSLIAPKPSITPPYLQRLTNPINLLYNIYTLNAS